MMVALSSTGGIFFNRDPNNHVLPPQPGYGAGFPNGNPDGYGYVEIGDRLPLTGDRIPDYYFRRYNVVPATQMFMPQYYNPYVYAGSALPAIRRLWRSAPDERPTHCLGRAARLTRTRTRSTRRHG